MIEEGIENVRQYLQTKTSPKRSKIFEDLLSNFIHNMFSGAGIKSISKHLSMKPELIPNIFDTKLIGKKILDIICVSMKNSFRLGRLYVMSVFNKWYPSPTRTDMKFNGF